MNVRTAQRIKYSQSAWVTNMPALLIICSILCGLCRGEQKRGGGCIHDFGGETSGKETTFLSYV